MWAGPIGVTPNDMIPPPAPSYPKINMREKRKQRSWFDFSSDESLWCAHRVRGAHRLRCFPGSWGGADYSSTSTAFGITGCRSDPLVTLSNGMQVRLTATIMTDPSQVSNVAYTLHVPQGLSVTSVQYDNGPLPETFNWVADKPPVDKNGNGQFTSQTQVTTVASTPAGPPSPGAPPNPPPPPSSNAGVYVNAYGLAGAIRSVPPRTVRPVRRLGCDFQIQPSSGNSTSLGDSMLTGSAPQDLIVPSGVACTVSNMTVGGNVQVQSGGSLNATNLRVAGNLVAQQAASMVITGGSVGHDAQFVGLSSGASSLCGVAFGHNLVLQNSTAGASITMGDPSAGCAGNTVGGDLQIQKNALSSITAVGNTATGNAQCQGNITAAYVVSGNSVAGNNQGC